MHVLGHGGQPVYVTAAGGHEVVKFLKNVAFVGFRPEFCGLAVNSHDVKALSQPDLGPLFGQVNADSSAIQVVGHVLGTQGRHGGDGVAHAVLA